MKFLDGIRLISWIFRVISCASVATALGISIYLDETKSRTNHGSLGVVCYISLSWFLIIDVWEICALWPVKLLRFRLVPPLTVLNDVAAGILATAGFLFGLVYKYSCVEACDFRQSEIPKLWIVLQILFVTILGIRLFLIATSCWDGCLQMKVARRERREEARLAEEEAREYA